MPSTRQLLNTGSGVLLVALGLGVAALRPRRGANLLFALFSVAFGLRFVGYNLLTRDDPALALAWWLGAAATAPALAGILGVAWLLPRPVAARERSLLAPAAAVGAVYAAASVAAFLAVPPDSWAPLAPPGAEGAFVAQAMSLWLTLGGLHAALALLALRLRALPAHARAEQRQLPLMGAALLLYVGFVAGAGPGGRPASVFADEPAAAALAAVGLGGLLVLAALWLRAAGGPAPRPASVVAWVGLAAGVAGLAHSAFDQDLGGHGVARTLGVVLLAYAILRHQLLGLDLKVKWTLRQSTVAAAFVGVFFVASESASTFLSAEAGLGPYLGIAAAGLLVFAMAPLQRAAERVASAAMPGVKAPTEMSPGERLGVYRDAAAQAWADGALDRSERLLLDRLQASLGLSRDEAMRAEQEAARDAG